MLVLLSTCDVLVNIILDVVGDLIERQTLDELKKVTFACVLLIF